MKFEVVGWLSYDDYDYPFHEGEHGAVDRAVIKAIREGGYRFGGNTQEYCSSGVPVLNDGTRAYYSWRGWGSIMAQALELPSRGGYEYMAFYMDHPDIETGRSREIILPPRGVDTSLFKKREELSEEFEMHLVPAAFEAVVSGKKAVELRALDEKRGLVCAGDYITFLCGEKSCRKKVRLVYDYFDGGDIFERHGPVRPAPGGPSPEEILQGAMFEGCETPEALWDFLVDMYKDVELTKTPFVAIMLEK